MGGGGKSSTTDQSSLTQQQQQTVSQQQADQAQTSATTGLTQFLSDFLNQTSQQATQQQQQQQQQQGTQSQTTNLPAFQQPIVKQYFDDLMSKYNAGGLTPQVYSGDRTADATPEELQARKLTSAYATGGAGDFANSALLANKTLLDPSILDPSKVPGLQGVKEGLTQQLTRNLTEQELPRIRNSALLSGGYGGSRQGIAEGLATGRTNEAIANASAGIDMNAYSQGLQAMQNALGLAPSTVNVGNAPAQLLQQAGAAGRADTQADIEAERQKTAEQNAQTPTMFSLLQQLAGTAGQYGATSTGTTAGTATGTQSGTSAQTGTQSGQQSSTQLSQQIMDMVSKLTGSSFSNSLGSSQTQAHSQTNEKENGGLLQTIGSLAALFMMFL